MAPELFQDLSTHSSASDIWAFGCTLYEMATGQPPFVNESLSELLSQIQESDPEEIAGELYSNRLVFLFKQSTRCHLKVEIKSHVEQT